MPAPRPPEFRRRAVELARQGEQPVAAIAQDLGISESCLRRWMGRRRRHRPGRGGELERARRPGRVAPPQPGAGEMEVEVLERAGGYFARENIPPEECSRWSRDWPRTGYPSR